MRITFPWAGGPAARRFSAQAAQIIEEGKFVMMIKMPHVDLKELVEVENTTTHPHLLATLDKFITHCAKKATCVLPESQRIGSTMAMSMIEWTRASWRSARWR